MNDKELEITEVEETKDLQIVPSSMLSNVVNNADDIELAIHRIEKHVELQSKMVKLALKVTNETDWVDQSGHPYLQASGAKKIRMCFGCTVSNVMYERTDYPHDENGAYFVIEVVGDISWNGQSIPETGTCSSRDAFFAKRKGVLLPMSEVDVTNIRKKALTNFYNRAIKSMLGLSFTWDEIEKATDSRITKDKCKGVKYNTGSKGGGETEKPIASAAQEIMREEIKRMMGEMYGKTDAPNVLEKNTTFESKENGKIVPGKRSVKDLSIKQIEMIHPQLKKAFEKWVEEGASVTTSDPVGTPVTNGRKVTKLPKELQAIYDSAKPAQKAEYDALNTIGEKEAYLETLLPF